MLLRFITPVAPVAMLAPEPRLLFVRLLCVLLFAIGVFILLNLKALRASPLFASCVLIILALPGASESLARCSNDASVLAWSAVLLYAAERRAGPWFITLLAITGPLLKLTAIPVVVVVVIGLWSDGRRRTAIMAGICSLLVFPLQLVRGWKWGGTYELNRPGRPWEESLSATVVGFVRSAYTFVKTTFWLGEGTFFHAPTVLVIAYGILLGAAAFACRRRRIPRWLFAHVAGLGVAACGFTLFAIANRRFFGGWGGVGGWYVWGWYPWLVVAAYDTLLVRRPWSRILVTATILFTAATNIVFYTIAYRLYG
jgi:hypothetical protein